MLRKFLIFILVFSLVLQPLLVSTVYAEEVNIKYTDSNHLHAPKEVNSVIYEYDANGNLTSDGERTIKWNQDNLPVKIKKGNLEVRFYYDANGQRVAKEVKDASSSATISKTIYVNQYYQLSIVNGQSTATKHYFANGRIAQRTGSNLVFLHQDHLGSTVLATNNQSQSTSDSLSYFPYGSSVNNLTIQQFSNYLFTGQELDPESDLYNYLARLYNPTTGAFISADPVGGGNRYAYAANNPMVYVDPTGHNSIWNWISKIISAGSKTRFAGEFIFLVGGALWLAGKGEEALYTAIYPYAVEYAEVGEMMHGVPAAQVEARYEKGFAHAESMQSVGTSMMWGGMGLSFSGSAFEQLGYTLGGRQSGKEAYMEKAKAADEIVQSSRQSAPKNLLGEDPIHFQAKTDVASGLYEKSTEMGIPVHITTSPRYKGHEITDVKVVNPFNGKTAYIEVKTTLNGRTTVSQQLNNSPYIKPNIRRFVIKTGPESFNNSWTQTQLNLERIGITTFRLDTLSLNSPEFNYALQTILSVIW